MKLSPFSLTAISFTALIATKLVTAEEQTAIQPLDEDFLEFIANMSEIDGEIVDTLDMLEIADNDMNSNKTLADDFNTMKSLDQNSAAPGDGSSVKEKQP